MLKKYQCPSGCTCRNPAGPSADGSRLSKQAARNAKKVQQRRQLGASLSTEQKAAQNAANTARVRAARAAHPPEQAGAEQAANITARSAARAARPPEQADADRAVASARRQARRLGGQGPRLAEGSSPLYHPLQPALWANTAAFHLNLFTSLVLHSQLLMQDPLSLSQLGQQPLGPASDSPGMQQPFMPPHDQSSFPFATPFANEPLETSSVVGVMGAQYSAW